MASVAITARPRGGFRRCGVHHPAETTVYPAGFFSDDELEVLEAEPQLVVEFYEDDEGSARSATLDTHLRLMNVGDRSTRSSAAAEREISEHSEPDAGHAPSSTPSHGQSTEQSAVEGSGVSAQHADRTGDSAESEDAIANPKTVPVSKLEELLASIPDAAAVIRMQDADDRKSAQPLYAARLAALTSGAE